MKRLSNPKLSATNEAIRKTSPQQIYDAARSLVAQGKVASPEAICKVIGAPLGFASRLRRTAQRKGPKLLEAYVLALEGRAWPDNLDEIARKTSQECDLAIARLERQLGTSNPEVVRLKKGSKMGWGILDKYDLAALERGARANNVGTVVSSNANEQSEEKVRTQTGNEQNAPDSSEEDDPEEDENHDVNVKEAPAPEQPVTYESKEEGLARLTGLSSRVEKVRSNLRAISSQPWTKRVSSEINALTLKIATFADTAEDLKELCKQGLLPSAQITLLQKETDAIEQALRDITHPRARPEEL